VTCKGSTTAVSTFDVSVELAATSQGSAPTQASGSGKATFLACPSIDTLTPQISTAPKQGLDKQPAAPAISLQQGATGTATPPCRADPVVVYALPAPSDSSSSSSSCLYCGLSSSNVQGIFHTIGADGAFTGQLRTAVTASCTSTSPVLFGNLTVRCDRSNSRLLHFELTNPLGGLGANAELEYMLACNPPITGQPCAGSGWRKVTSSRASALKVTTTSSGRLSSWGAVLGGVGPSICRCDMVHFAVRQTGIPLSSTACSSS
jgi:hypothetical protein